MIKRLLIVVAVCAAAQDCGTCLAAETNNPVVPTTVTSMDRLDAQRKLGPGDKVTYRVIEDKDEPKSLTITDSGDLDVPYLGLVKAAGKSSLQLAKEIKGLLEKNLYYQATVIIAVELVNTKRVTGIVYVTGQVRNTGGYDIPSGENFTVSKAIMKAGGFSDFSNKKNVRLIRNAVDGKKTFVINVAEVLEKGKPEKDMVVQPDDTIFVPASLINY